ncbi:MAG: LacI family DNA-binding transcriptional regulator [Opitutaceae bacterium]|jgi:LacI family transcriptional regulator
MSTRPPSLSDIALKACVAKSTVSMALRNHPRISKKQRLRIQKIAVKMGYQNNALLGQLMHELRRSRKQTYVATLAFVNASMDPQVRSRISIVNDWLIGAETRAKQLGYTLDYLWLHEPGISPKRLAQILRARNVQGVAFYALDPNSMLHDWAPIWEQFSTVTVGARHHSPALHFVSNDQYTTAYKACDQLWALGYRRIGTFIETWLDDILERRFIAGYLARKGATSEVPILYFDDELGINQQNKPQHQHAFNGWFNKHRPDAILCNSSHVLTWLNALNLRIPEDIGVALLDLPREMKGIAAGMEQNPSWTGISAIEVLVGQVLRRETGVPPFQQGTMIESTWIPGPTVRKV